MTKPETVIAVIGGSGLYSLAGLQEVKELAIDTPFGAPSGPIVSGRFANTRLLFLARHGPHHSYLPSEVNYCANMWALKKLGATWCIGVSAVGSLQEEMKPGDLVVPDQIIDKTFKRRSTFFGDGITAHVPMANPYCALLRNTLIETIQDQRDELAIQLHNSGTLVVMEGPAFSTRAESHLHRMYGAHLIGMTAQPEAKLAREAEIGYATLACVTDYDCWRSDGDDVSVGKVLETQRNNTRNVAIILEYAIPQLAALTPPIETSEALQHAIMTNFDSIPEETLQRLAPILKRVIGKST